MLLLRISISSIAVLLFFNFLCSISYLSHYIILGMDNLLLLIEIGPENTSKVWLWRLESNDACWENKDKKILLYGHEIHLRGLLYNEAKDYDTHLLRNVRLN